jgi:hypothetical protein
LERFVGPAAIAGATASAETTAKPASVEMVSSLIGASPSQLAPFGRPMVQPGFGSVANPTNKKPATRAGIYRHNVLKLLSIV